MIRGLDTKAPALGERIVVAYASCSCGWATYRRADYAAQAAAETHAASHRARGEAVRLPLVPIREAA